MSYCGVCVCVCVVTGTGDWDCPIHTETVLGYLLYMCFVFPSVFLKGQFTQK